jgi:hypothetical protein
MIKAECHSDDRKVEVTFDAEPFLNQADTSAIKALIACGLGGDYAADRVAEYMMDHDPKVKKMFDYTSLVDEGFECHIEDAQAFWNWVKKNKPALQSGEVILEDEVVSQMSEREAKEKLISLLAYLLLDMDHEAMFLSKSKHIDDDQVDRIRQAAINMIPENLILE